MADPDLELRRGTGFFEMLKQNRFANIACPAGFSSFYVFSLFYFSFFFANVRRGSSLDPPLKTLDAANTVVVITSIPNKEHSFTGPS